MICYKTSEYFSNYYANKLLRFISVQIFVNYWNKYTDFLLNFYAAEDTEWHFYSFLEKNIKSASTILSWNVINSIKFNQYISSM